ncbi:hypothetical protein ACA910_022155 [Epithemia clementina (nom. ined.)]
MNMPLAQQLGRFIGMTIEIPHLWEDDDGVASICSIFEKESVTANDQDDDHSTGCSTGCAGVRFQDNENLYYDQDPMLDVCNAKELWVTPDEIQLFMQQAQNESSLLQEQQQVPNNEGTAITSSLFAILESVYKTCCKAKVESSKQSFLNQEQYAALQSIYNSDSSPNSSCVEGLERKVLAKPSSSSSNIIEDGNLRRQTILRVVQQLQQRPAANNNRAAMLHRENAIRQASQSISRPERIFAREIANAQYQALQSSAFSTIKRRPLSSNIYF